MRKLLLIVTILLFSAHVVKSQENYIKGSILLLNKDTLHGLIDYRDREQTPAKIRFKTSSGDIKTFKPVEINAFSVGKDIVFLSKRLAMDVSNCYLEDLVSNASVRIVSDTAVFVRLIVRGPLNLYYMKDAKEKEHFWFQKGHDSIFEMRIARKIVKTPGVTIVSDWSLAKLNIYQLFLPGIVSDCPAIAEKAKTTEFSMKDFERLALKYNECITGMKASPTSKVKKIRFTFGLVAGASTLNLKFFGAKIITLTHVTFPAVWTYTGGVALKIILPYLNGSWIIYNDIVYRPYHLSGTYDTINIFSPGISSHYTCDFSMGYLKLNTMLRYQFPKWVVKPFINVGMSNSYALVNNNTYTKMTNTQPNPTYEEGPAIESSKSYEAGFICGIGACVKGMGLEVRYEWANGMSAYAGFTGSENSFTFLLSYTFGQK
jgi:hypothetical protein